MFDPKLKELFLWIYNYLKQKSGVLAALLIAVAALFGYELNPDPPKEMQGIVSQVKVNDVMFGKPCLYEVIVSGEVETAREGVVIAPQGLPDGYKTIDLAPWRYDKKLIPVEGTFKDAEDLFNRVKLSVPPPGGRTIVEWNVGPTFAVARFQCKQRETPRNEK